MIFGTMNKERRGLLAMGIARAGQIAGRREYPNAIRDNEQRKAEIARDIARARQMVGRRGYSNDIRDNE